MKSYSKLEQEKSAAASKENIFKKRKFEETDFSEFGGGLEAVFTPAVKRVKIDHFEDKDKYATILKPKQVQAQSQSTFMADSIIKKP